MLPPQSPPKLDNISNQDIIRRAITDIRQTYCYLDSKLKKVWVNDVCPHPNGCLHYIISVSNKIKYLETESQ